MHHDQVAREFVLQLLDVVEVAVEARHVDWVSIIEFF
jgi:hypothetical protein